MKIRQGFVSNSSSSSFIVAVKSISGSSVISKMRAFVRNKDYGTENSMKVLKTEKDVRESLDYHGSNEMDISFKQRIMLANAFEGKDYKLLLLSISYHDEDFNALIQENADVRILWSFD